jgi:hypothetical protein
MIFNILLVAKKKKDGPSWAEEGRAGHYGVPRYCKQRTAKGEVPGKNHCTVKRPDGYMTIEN